MEEALLRGMLVNRWRNRIQCARGCGNSREDEHHAKPVKSLCAYEAARMVAPSEHRPVSSHVSVREVAKVQSSRRYCRHCRRHRRHHQHRRVTYRLKFHKVAGTFLNQALWHNIQRGQLAGTWREVNYEERSFVRVSSRLPLLAS